MITIDILCFGNPSRNISLDIAALLTKVVQEQQREIEELKTIIKER